MTFKEDLKFALLFLLAVSLVIGFFLGVGTAVSDYSKGGCTYGNLGSRINPGYVIPCELFRKRW